MGAKLSPDVVSYASVIDAHARGGGLAEAERWFSKMLVAQVAPTDLVYNSMLHACAKAREADKAEAWSGHLEAAGLRPGRFALACLVDACGRAGRPREAEAWLLRMEAAAVEADAVVYTAALQACGRAQPPLPELAERLLRRMAVRRVRPDRRLCAAAVRALGERRFEGLRAELVHEARGSSWQLPPLGMSNRVGL